MTSRRRAARRLVGQTRPPRLWDSKDLFDMYDKAGSSCWGWTFWALAFSAIAIAFIYLFGGFEIASAVVQ